MNCVVGDVMDLLAECVELTLEGHCAIADSNDLTSVADALLKRGYAVNPLGATNKNKKICKTHMTISRDFEITLTRQSCYSEKADVIQDETKKLLCELEQLIAAINCKDFGGCIIDVTYVSDNGVSRFDKQSNLFLIARAVFRATYTME